MKTAVCDPEAFYPLRNLVTGPFTTLEHLGDIERFIRTVALHDTITMELQPVWGTGEWVSVADAGVSPTEPGLESDKVMPFAVGPSLAGFDFISGPSATGILADDKKLLVEFAPESRFSIDGKEGTGINIRTPAIKLAPALMELAREYGKGHVGMVSHMVYLMRVMAILAEGGSAVLRSHFGRTAIEVAERYPAELFRQLDEDWQAYAKTVLADGFELLTPPVLGIVLSRCARREAIPAVINDLREEWATARKKVWDLFDSLRTCRTLDEAVQIRKELADASELFSPERTELDTRPARVLWEIVSATAAGFGVAALSGGKPEIGAVAGALAQAGRNLPSFTHEFGAILFGRGAFDLARRVRRAVSQVELDALPRLLTASEREQLGFR